MMKRLATIRTSEITRDHRLKLVRELFKRWGRMNQQQLQERVAALLGSNIETLRRTLYRDLEYLVGQGEIEELRTTRNGDPIEDFDPEVHKSTLVEWTLPKNKIKTGGAGLIESIGGNILISRAVQNDIKIEEGISGERPNQMNFYFSVAHLFLRLRVQLTELPISLVVCRVPELGRASLVFSEIEKTYTRRLVLLSLPIATLSSQHEISRPGHCCITAMEAGKVEVVDFGSRNGTTYCQIAQNLASEIVYRAFDTGGATVTKNWGTENNATSWLKVPPSGNHLIVLPTLLRLSHNFVFLIRPSPKPNAEAPLSLTRRKRRS